MSDIVISACYVAGAVLTQVSKRAGSMLMSYKVRKPKSAAGMSEDRTGGAGRSQSSVTPLDALEMGVVGEHSSSSICLLELLPGPTAGQYHQRCPPGMTILFEGFILEVGNCSTVADHDVARGRKNCFGGCQMPLEKLAHPPIVEVICGIIFDALRGMDPLMLGVYWERRRAEYPQHQILPAIGAADLVLGLGGYPPARTWFISTDDSQVLQLQSDRFYLNWRKRGGSYPRFSQAGGLLERAQSEFHQFSEFCHATLGQPPRPRAIELGKTDHFLRGRHFTDSADLASMIPTLQQALSLTSTASPEIALHLRETRDGGVLRVGARTVTLMGEAGQRDVVLQMETTINRLVEAPETAAITSAFTEANEEANRVFEALIPREQRDRRFQEATT
jgi:uncharacterized protein (TIGR04255 family)